MRQNGHATSSTPRTSTIKLRISRIQELSPINLKKYETTWKITTNFTTRPIELLVDTGAQITLINEQLLKDDIILQNKPIQLTGFDGTTNATTTKGMYVGKFFTEDQMSWPVEAHIVDRKSAGPYDGYLGYDFLQYYNAIIDLEKGTLQLRILPENREENANEIVVTDQTNNRIEDCSDSDSDASTDSTEHKFNRTSTINNGPFIPSLACKSMRNGKANYIENFANNTALQNALSKQKEEIAPKALIAKIVKNGHRLNSEASAYIRYFGTKKFHMSNNNNEESQMKFKVFAINMNQSRTNVILQALKLSHVNDQEKQAVANIVQAYQFQFFVEGDKLTKTNLVKHEIILEPGTGIINVRQFRLPQTSLLAIKKSTQEMLEQQIVIESRSPFNAPTFMVPKKDEFGGMTAQRQVHDYRELNSCTIMQTYPIPRVQELVDNFAQCKFITLIDVKSAFNQIEIHQPHKHYTAFTVAYRKYQFERMPFGLSGGPGTQQEMITRALADLLDRGVSVYMDDVSIYTRTFEEQIELIKEVFSRFKKYNIQANIKKCTFFAKSVEYLGFIIENGEVKPNPNKAKIIRNYPMPQTRKQVQSFLGMLTYYKIFIKNFAHIAKPLHALTSPEIPFEMNDAAKRAVERLKIILADDVTLKIVDFTKKFILATDASDIALGAVLSQPEGKADRPIQFYSRVLNKHEVNYPAHERELLALTNSIAEFETYLKGRKFTVLTDSQCLVYLFANTHKNKRLIRQAIGIIDSNFDIRYQPGKLNVVADALSRIEVPDQNQWDEIPITEFIKRHVKPTKQLRAITRSRTTVFDQSKNKNDTKPFIQCANGLATEKCGYDHVFSVISLANKTLIEKLTQDSEFEKTSKFIQISDKHSIITINSLPIKQDEIKAIVNTIFKFTSDNEAPNIAINTDIKAKHLFEFKYLLQQAYEKISITITLHINQIIELIDPLEIQQALHMHHHLRLGGHAGIERMEKTMKKIYKWNGMSKDIKKYVLNCSTCERAKVTKYIKTPMMITSTGESPFDHMFLDYVGPVSPPSSEGYKYIFVATCDLTGFSIAIPTRDMTAATTADCYVRHIILQYGFPSTVSTDRGTDFMAELFKQVNKKLKIKQISTTPYNPKANCVERRNRSTSEYLKCYTELKPETWAELLPYCTLR